MAGLFLASCNVATVGRTSPTSLDIQEPEFGTVCLPRPSCKTSERRRQVLAEEDRGRWSSPFQAD